MHFFEREEEHDDAHRDEDGDDGSEAAEACIAAKVRACSRSGTAVSGPSLASKDANDD